MTYIKLNSLSSFKFIEVTHHVMNVFTGYLAHFHILWQIPMATIGKRFFVLFTSETDFCQKCILWTHKSIGVHLFNSFHLMLLDLNSKEGKREKKSAKKSQYYKHGLRRCEVQHEYRLFSQVDFNRRNFCLLNKKGWVTFISQGKLNQIEWVKFLPIIFCNRGQQRWSN